MKNKLLKYLLFAVLFGMLGYFREFFFVNVNNIMYNKYYGDQVEIPESLSFLEAQSYQTIYYLKYLFTIISFCLFFLLSYYCVKNLSIQPGLVKWLKYSYALLLFLSAAAMLWAYFIKGNLQDNEYTFSRWVMGIAQSPLPVLFLLAAEHLNARLNEK
jgi:hypothetical protein